MRSEATREWASSSHPADVRASTIEQIEWWRVPLDMVHTRILLFCLAALASATILAQPGDALDSVLRDSLMAFDARMRAEPTSAKALAPLSEYVLVWKDHCDGGPSWITRGDTTMTLANFRYDGRPVHGMGPLSGMFGGPIFYGDRYAYIGIELPTGLVRYTHWYFERRRR